MNHLACCQYEIELLQNWQAYEAKIEQYVIKAKETGAICLLLPEYAGIEAACSQFSDEKALFKALQPLIPRYINLYKKLAQTHKIYIQAGTIMEKVGPGKYANRAYFFSPTGLYDYQDKLNLIEQEKEAGLLSPGTQQKIFQTPFGKVGIVICYDSEFPEVIRNLTQQGATLILVPSYTTSMAGYNRVFLSCRARAIENQCYIAISYVVNTVDMGGDADYTHGQAAILSPVDLNFPDDGIIAQGTEHTPMIITGEICNEKICWIRKKGQVLNYQDSLAYKSQSPYPINCINFC